MRKPEKGDWVVSQWRDAVVAVLRFLAQTNPPDIGSLGQSSQPRSGLKKDGLNNAFNLVDLRVLISTTSGSSRDESWALSILANDSANALAFLSGTRRPYLLQTSRPQVQRYACSLER